MKERTCFVYSHTAQHCNILQHTATYYNTLQYTLPLGPWRYRNIRYIVTLQHTATHFNTLQYTATGFMGAEMFPLYSHTATHCNTLQHTSTGSMEAENVPYAVTLQHTATHCDTLRHTATHCNILQQGLWRQRNVSCIVSAGVVLSLVTVARSIYEMSSI